MDRLHNDVLDMVCSFLGVPESMNTIGLLNHKYHKFVQSESTAMWDHHMVMFSSDNNDCVESLLNRLRVWSRYVTRIRKLFIRFSSEACSNSAEKMQDGFRVPFHLFLEVVAPRLKALIIHGFVYQQPLAYYPFQHLDWLELMDSRPTHFCSFLAHTTHKVKRMVVNNRKQTMPRLPCQDWYRLIPTECKDDLQAFSRGWDWSLAQFVDMSQLTVLEEYCDDNASMYGSGQYEFPMRLIKDNKDTLRCLTLYSGLFGEKDNSQDEEPKLLPPSSVFSHLKNLQHLELICPSGYFDRIDRWASWYNNVILHVVHGITFSIHLPSCGYEILHLFHCLKPAYAVHRVRILASCTQRSMGSISEICTPLFLKAFPCIKEIRLDHCTLVPHFSRTIGSIVNTLPPVPTTCKAHTLHMCLPCGVSQSKYEDKFFVWWSQALPCLKTLILDINNKCEDHREKKIRITSLGFLLHIVHRFQSLERLVVTGLNVTIGEFHNLPPLTPEQFGKHPLRWLHLHGALREEAWMFLATCFPHVPIIVLHDRDYNIAIRQLLLSNISNDFSSDSNSSAPYNLFDCDNHDDTKSTVKNSEQESVIMKRLVQMEQKAAKIAESCWMGTPDAHTWRTEILAHTSMADRLDWMRQYTKIYTLVQQRLCHLQIPPAFRIDMMRAAKVQQK